MSLLPLPLDSIFLIIDAYFKFLNYLKIHAVCFRHLLGLNFFLLPNVRNITASC
jgi:hypothetical protein